MHELEGRVIAAVDIEEAGEGERTSRPRPDVIFRGLGHAIGGQQRQCDDQQASDVAASVADLPEADFVEEPEGGDPHHQRGQFLDEVVPVVARTADGEDGGEDRQDARRYGDSRPGPRLGFFRVRDPHRERKAALYRFGDGRPQSDAEAREEEGNGDGESEGVEAGFAARERDRRKDQAVHGQEKDQGPEGVTEQELQQRRTPEPTGDHLKKIEDQKEKQKDEQVRDEAVEQAEHPVDQSEVVVAPPHRDHAINLGQEESRAPGGEEDTRIVSGRLAGPAKAGPPLPPDQR